MGTPAIHISKQAAFWRVKVEPAQDLPAEVRRPETWASISTARAAANHIAKATGWPILDHTLVGR